VRFWTSLAALALITTACQKELGELCKEDKECESEACSVLGFPGASDKKVCAGAPPCEDGGVEYLGDCLRRCTVTADCLEGTACYPHLGGCFPACERDDQCGNNTCSQPGEVCD
jgi:hypothetical protein